MCIEENPFDHILYEIEMYLASYKVAPCENDPLKPFVVNFIADSRAIHLRNLAVFFYINKTDKFWHVGDYLSNTHAISFLYNETTFKDIKNYTSRATGHLLNQRLSESFKSETLQCYQEAYPLIVEAIKSFFIAMDNDVKPEYKADWDAKSIQNIVSFIKTRLLPTPQIITGTTGAV